jgi:prepilin-type N-terminal cleavage/methylation domain-containing protein
MSRKRAFSLFELMVGLVVGGILLGLALSATKSTLDSAHAHAQARRFAHDVERARADALRQGQHSSVSAVAAPNGTDIRYRAMRYGSAGVAPCVHWHDSLVEPTPNVRSDNTVFYEDIAVSVIVPLRMCPLTCVNEKGLPVSPDTSSGEPAVQIITIEMMDGTPLEVIQFETDGTVTSSNNLFESGISGSSFKPQNHMQDESAAVVVGLIDGGALYPSLGDTLPLPSDMITD